MRYTAAQIAAISEARNAYVVRAFWARVDKSGECWLWTGTLDKDGYGRALRKGENKAHRVAYVLTRGAIPTGLQIDHLCRVRRCVNPSHLEPVTNAENRRRGATTGGALYQRPTHCPQGHEFTAENTYAYGGERLCRTCRRARNFAQWQREQQERNAA